MSGYVAFLYVEAGQLIEGNAAETLTSNGNAGAASVFLVPSFPML